MCFFLKWSLETSFQGSNLIKNDFFQIFITSLARCIIDFEARLQEQGKWHFFKSKIAQKIDLKSTKKVFRAIPERFQVDIVSIICPNNAVFLRGVRCYSNLNRKYTFYRAMCGIINHRRQKFCMFAHLLHSWLPCSLHWKSVFFLSQLLWQRMPR